MVFGQPDVKVIFSGDGKTGTFSDAGRDLVTVKVSKGALGQRDFTFSGGTLQKINFADDGEEFAGVNLTMRVKRLFAGNGTVNVGAIDAHGLDLGMVALPGDLGQIDAGDANFKTPAIESLTVGTRPGATVKPLQSAAAKLAPAASRATSS